MAKILSANVTTTTIGMDDGSIKEVATNTLSFLPHTGQSVEVYCSENQIFVNPIEETPVTPTQINYINGKRVNKIAYGLLAIFLGGFGIHRFYAGKPISGVLYLLFCWTFIPTIISFIEGIVALTKHADENGDIII